MDAYTKRLFRRKIPTLIMIANVLLTSTLVRIITG